MSIRTRILAAFIWALVLAPRSASALAAEKDVEVSSRVGVSTGSTFDLHVRFQLPEGLHLYKDSLVFSWDELRGVRQPELLFPAAKTIADFGDVYEATVQVVVRFVVTGAPKETVAVRGQVEYAACEGTLCLLPQTRPIQHTLSIASPTDQSPETVGSASAPGVASERSTAANEQVPRSQGRKGTVKGPSSASAGTKDRPLASREQPPKRAGWKEFMWWIVTAFLAGIGISLTPCVYPMIPITLAVVGGQKERSKAVSVLLSAVYVLGISITYSIAGYFIAKLGSSVEPTFQSPFLLVPIAGVFVLFALSMFDVITIQTPPRLSGLVQRLSGRQKGAIGVLVLGMASGLVAGPCVSAPLLAILTKIARGGDRLLGFWTMFAVAWGMGLLLIVAGASSSVLPKAGPWMEWLKKLFGFIMLWAAVYFLRPLVGEAAFQLLTASALLAGVVFLGCLDVLTAESSVGDRVKRLIGLAAVLVAALLAFSGFSELAGVQHPASALTAKAPSPFAQADESLLQAALRSGQPVIVDFYGERCSACKKLDRTTFADEIAIKALARFRALKIDVGRHRDIAKRLNVPAVPALILFDSKGEQREIRVSRGGRAKLLGFEDVDTVDEFLKILEQVE